METEDHFSIQHSVLATTLARRSRGNCHPLSTMTLETPSESRAVRPTNNTVLESVVTIWRSCSLMILRKEEIIVCQAQEGISKQLIRRNLERTSLWYWSNSARHLSIQWVPSYLKEIKRFQEAGNCRVQDHTRMPRWLEDPSYCHQSKLKANIRSAKHKIDGTRQPEKSLHLLQINTNQWIIWIRTTTRYTTGTSKQRLETITKVSLTSTSKCKSRHRDQEPTLPSPTSVASTKNEVLNSMYNSIKINYKADVMCINPNIMKRKNSKLRYNNFILFNDLNESFS